jgi:hypothetical protein
VDNDPEPGIFLQYMSIREREIRHPATRFWPLAPTQGNYSRRTLPRPNLQTLPPGTRINGSTYKVPKFLGNAFIHFYSDFLLQDVGTGDGIPQAAKCEYLDPCPPPISSAPRRSGDYGSAMGSCTTATLPAPRPLSFATAGKRLPYAINTKA